MFIFCYFSDGPQPDKLNYVFLPLMSTANCRQCLYVSDGMLCAGNCGQNSGDSCQVLQFILFTDCLLHVCLAISSTTCSFWSPPLKKNVTRNSKRKKIIVKTIMNLRVLTKWFYQMWFWMIFNYLIEILVYFLIENAKAALWTDKCLIKLILIWILINF